ncbi:MAG: GTP-binding protein, partial [Cellulomonadaceae bacterium]
MHHFADHRVALSTLTTIDPVLRDSALFGLLVDAPRTVALRHDIRADDGMLRRVVLDATGVLEDVLVPLEHACLSCTVREDAIPQLRALAQDGRWDSIVLALPVAAEPLAVIRALTHETQRGGELDGLRIASTVTVVDVERAEADLLDDALVAERGIGLTDADDRSVGEVLSAQLEQADVVVVEGERRTAPTGSGLVERLRAAGSTRVEGVFALSAQDLAARRHHHHADERRAHPSGDRAAQPLQADPGDASWTLELSSTLPFHPEPRLDEIVRQGTGRLRSRGVFWVPNRP